MNINRVIFRLTEKWKPILLKIFPKEFLNKKKLQIFNNAIKRLSKYDKEKYDSEKFPIGINLIANIRADTGLGESSRIVARHLMRANIPFTIIEWSSSTKEKGENQEFINEISNIFKYAINIIHVNAHEFGIAIEQLGFDKLDYHYNIAFWSWEREQFPEEWRGNFKVLDEIWTPSLFTSKAIQRITEKKVYTIPHTILPMTLERKADKVIREEFCLPKDKFLVLVLYNAGSVDERKNPVAAIRAYKRAFSDSNNAGLVIKVGECTEEVKRRIFKETGGIRNVYYIFETLSKERVNALIKCIDVYISLHRAEGFGLVLAEAMALGKPVIATNWSANTEFMDEESSCLVDYNLIKVNTEMAGFKKNYIWAEANIEQAAFFLEKLFSDKNYYTTISKNAIKAINKELNPIEISQLVYRHYIDIINGDETLE